MTSSAPRTSTGNLYVVATPIGNLKDLSERARTVLSSVHAIVAEDTRHAKHLMQCLALKTPILPVHLRKEQIATEHIIQQLDAGHHLALISDAGTPAVSDPGSIVVRTLLDAGYPVIPIPGACSAITAWSASGFTDTHFLFYGFLPSKSQARRTILHTLSKLTFAIIFYEAPHRIRETLSDLLLIFGNRKVTLARELTKTYETIRRDDLRQLTSWAHEDSSVERGELVITIEGAADNTPDTLDNSALNCLKEMLATTSLVSAVKWTQTLTGLPRDLIYKHALELKNERSEY